MTPLQEAISEELDKYTSIETMRDKAQEIADNVAKRDTIASCSKTYVLRRIKHREDSSAKVQIKVTPPEQTEDEPEDSDSFDEDDGEEVDDIDWPSDEESESTEGTKPEDIPLGEILSKENVEMLINVPFRMAADFTGWDGAELTEDESKRLTPMARAIMLKYVPDLMAMYFIEIVFILVCGEIVVSKYRAYNEFSSEQESKKKAQEEATKQADIAEKRKLEQEEAAKKTAETPPEPEEEKPPRTKEEAGNPTWNEPGAVI